jgi:hypothetical protein
MYQQILAGLRRHGTIWEIGKYKEKGGIVHLGTGNIRKRFQQILASLRRQGTIWSMLKKVPVDSSLSKEYW